MNGRQTAKTRDEDHRERGAMLSGKHSAGLVLMPVFLFKTYRRSQKGGTTGTLSAMQDVGADSIREAEQKVSGHFAVLNFEWYFAVLESEDGKEFCFWFQDKRNA
jgi:hypothetical protein